MMNVSATLPTWSLRTPILTAQLPQTTKQPCTRNPPMESISFLEALSLVRFLMMMPLLQDLKAGNIIRSKSRTRTTRRMKTKTKKSKSTTRKKVNRWAPCARKLNFRVSKNWSSLWPLLLQGLKNRINLRESLALTPTDANLRLTSTPSHAIWKQLCP